MTETSELTPKVTQELSPKVTPEITPEQRIEPDQPVELMEPDQPIELTEPNQSVELTEPNDPRKKIEQNNLPQKTKDAALTILDTARTNTEQHRKPINRKFMINLIVVIGFLGGTTACSESWQQRFDAQLDPAKYSDDPNVQRAYNIYLQEKEKEDLGADVESLIQAPELDLTNQSYEIFGAKQEFVAGTKVVVDAGGYGVNVRNYPEINSSEATIYPDGTIFIIDKFVGYKDGYNWVSVATEDDVILGYAATAWLKPLQP